MEFLDGLIHSCVNIHFGVCLAIILAAVLLFIVFVIKSGNSISLFSYLIVIILTLLLSIQFALMLGAISVKREIKDAEKQINRGALLLGDTGLESMEEIYEWVSEFQSIIPIFHPEIGTLTLGQIDKNDIGGSLMTPYRLYLNKYILFRIIWSFVFCVVAMITMIALTNAGGTSNYRKTCMRAERLSSRRNSEGRRHSRRIR